MREAIRKKLECGAPLRLTITALNTKQNYISRHGQQNTELFQRSQRHTNSAALNGRKVLYTEANQLRKAFLRQASIFPDLLYIFADFEIDRLFLFHSDTTFFISLTNGGVDYNHPFLL